MLGERYDITVRLFNMTSQLYNHYDVTTECIDCQLGWSEFEGCKNNENKRHQVVVSQPNRHGEKCPDRMKVDTVDCANCDIAWGPWGECYPGGKGFERRRSEYVAQDAYGGGEACRDLNTQFVCFYFVFILFLIC